MKIFNSISELVGHTPLLDVSNYDYSEKFAKIYAKLEYLNPAGSVKDRAALSMIVDAENRGVLKKGSVIVEPTSGNTGIGLAAIAADRGYRVILTMPDTMSIERRKLLKAYGTEIVLTDGKKGMSGAVQEAENIAKNTENSFLAGQFINVANVLAHYNTTGPEIYSDTDGKIDIFVAGVGTGGTLTGVGKYLKEKNKNIKIIAVEPEDSPLLSCGKAGPHGIQGIGANFVPQILDREIIDDIITVSTKDSYKSARLLGENKGVLVGISSGAALYAATVLANKQENENKNIVVLLPDTGDRYLSTELFG
ncbi:MAG: cysteine synthase A [Acutalibacteraceae bacterium]|nr:cysteine synthase A [Acutalibacteraceae bacterium]